MYSQTDHRRQYGACALHVGYLRLHVYTNRICDTAFPLQQWLHERTSMLRHTYSACLAMVRVRDSVLRYVLASLAAVNCPTHACWATTCLRLTCCQCDPSVNPFALSGSGVPRGGLGCSNPPPHRNSEDIGGVLDRISKKNRRLDFLL